MNVKKKRVLFGKLGTAVLDKNGTLMGGLGVELKKAAKSCNSNLS